MLKLLGLSVFQSVLLSGGQVLLKFALMRMGTFAWTRDFFINMLTNWWFLAMGICYGISTVTWMYILKHYPFSLAYPMISFSYVFGLLAAVIFFHESVTLTRWIGVLLIMGGCCLVAAK